MKPLRGICALWPFTKRYARCEMEDSGAIVSAEVFISETSARHLRALPMACWARYDSRHCAPGDTDRRVFRLSIFMVKFVLRMDTSSLNTAPLSSESKPG